MRRQRAPIDRRVGFILSLAQRGLTGQEIAESMGSSREWVRKLLMRAGHTMASARVARCTGCDRKLPAASRRSTGPAWCPTCERRVQNERERARYWAGRHHARCGSCRKELRLRPRADGKPRFCRDAPCRVAAQRWRLRNDPAYRARHYAATADWQRRAGWHRKNGAAALANSDRR